MILVDQASTYAQKNEILKTFLRLFTNNSVSIFRMMKIVYISNKQHKIQHYYESRVPLGCVLGPLSYIFYLNFKFFNSGKV